MTIQLLLGVHAHQPVGNFPEVIDDAMERCYRPFLRTLHRYPEFRFSAHFSGWLLDALYARYPDDMQLLTEMARRGQVELFGAGWAEPVLASISSRDRMSQLEAMGLQLEQRFGSRPRGAWLTERVWEATVVPALVDSGVRYVVVDDYHFLCTGREAGELDGYYTTEEDGRTLDAFPISEALRYRLPFSPAPDAVAYLESLEAQGHRAGVYFDDIEKFGIWPETHAWVYEQGWLTGFIEGVLASKKIATATYAQFHGEQRTRGVVYLPTASYIEMNEWTLPPRAAGEYARLVEQEKANGRYQQSKALLRGGIWRNFFSRYEESNWMHKRMLGLSQRLAKAPPGPHAQELLPVLHRAQANDAYWHGLFGGLYLPHLRRTVWNQLIELEQALDGIAPRSPLVRADVDCDGHDEVVLHNAHLSLAVRLDGSGAAHELSSYTLRHNFGDTLRRRDEHYYGRIRQDGADHRYGAGIASAHDRVSHKHPIAEEDLLADERPRSAFLDAWQAAGSGAWRPVDGYALTQASAPLHALEFAAPIDGGRIEKRIALDGPRIRIRLRASGEPRGRYAMQLNLALPSCDGYSGRYVLEDGTIPAGFGQALELPRCARLTLDDQALGGALALTAAPHAGVEARPFHTVSLSEAGFEKIMQGVCLTLSWALDGPAELNVGLEVLPYE